MKKEDLLKQFLLEDIGVRDITTCAIIDKDSQSEVQIIVKLDGIISGIDVARSVFMFVDDTLNITKHIQDGKSTSKGDVVMSIAGNTRSIFSAERTALNLLQRMSGIATMTSEYVQKISGTTAKILDTRKTAPGLRVFDKQAVRDGGGENHRFGLYDMFLIKDNHIDEAGSITSAVEKCKRAIDEKPTSGQKILLEVEVRNLEEFQEAIDLNLDRIMLDNMNVDDIRTSVILNKRGIELEASGNISLHNVRQVAETGIDFISIGALTHSVKALDISLAIKK